MVSFSRYNLIYVFVVLASILVFISCSDDEDPDINPRVYGTIQDESGVGIEGIRIILHNRMTNEKITGSTNEIGRYSIPLDFGSYNIGFFSDDFVTFYHGPVIINDSEYRLDKTLSPSSSQDNTLFYGYIYQEDGSPAIDHYVHIESFTNDSTESSYVRTDVLEDGSFALNIEGQIHFDLKIFGPPHDQHDCIPLMKIDKPCEIDFRLDPDYINYGAHHGGSAPATPNPSGPFPELSTPNMPFSWNGQADSYYVFPDPAHPYGQIGTQGKPMVICVNGYDSTNTDIMNIWIAEDGYWLDPYALHINGYPEIIPGINRNYRGTWYGHTRFYHEFAEDCENARINDPVLYVSGIGSWKTSFGYTNNNGICGNGSTPNILDASPENDQWVTITSLKFIPEE